ncbi:MAG: TolC family outer membrane protein [Proteobacteria bacterium]|nr:TolC family outer membrane protein [Pseudomonadota bacterium]
MKKGIFLITILLTGHSNATDLITIYRQALENDATYKQAELETFAENTDIAINRAYLLPHAQFEAQPLMDRQNNSGAIVPDIQPAFNNLRSYDMRLSLTQPIFNMVSYSRYKTAKITSKVALAKFNAATQALILRVAEAYFNVLRSKKRVVYLRAHEKALGRQLYDVKERYKAGKTTKTYVYVVESSYSSVESDLISAEDRLAADEEFLQQLTSEDLGRLADLKQQIPLVSPNPANANQWVKKSLRCNWLVKANQLKVQVARERIKENYAAHLPTLNAKLLYDNNAFHNTEDSLIVAAGSSRSRNTAAFLNLNVPLFAGGLTSASTRKAQYQFQIAEQKLRHSLKKVSYEVKQSYRHVVSNIKKIEYQKLSMKASNASMDGLKERYNYGSGSLTDVLNQESKLVKAQMQYESARYDYVINLLRLKKEAGTLSAKDLMAVNQWLEKTRV